MKPKSGIQRGKDRHPPAITNCKLFTTVSSGVICLLLALAIIFFDPIVSIAKYRTRLVPGSIIHDLLKTDFESVHVSLYLFNITNAERFVTGKDIKLKVEDVGPFTYRENRRNANFKLEPEGGLVRYTPVVNLTFVPEESIGDPRDLNVTVPNFSLLGMTTMYNSYPYLTRMGLNFLINSLKITPTINLRVHDYLWGYNDTLISLANTYMPHWIDFDKMGLLDRIYDPKKNLELVLRCKETDKLQIKSMGGVEGLSAWGYENPIKRSRCNSFNDVYEGIWYPNDMTPDKPIRIYRTALCRFLDLEYIGTRMTEFGCDALVYQIKNNSFTMDEDNSCLCDHGVCIDGLSDISPCYYGLPLAVSNVHFTDADPALRARIEGLNPNPEKIRSRFLVEPILGMALSTDFSVQVNLVAGDLRYNKAAAPFSNMVVPMAYLRITQPPLLQETKDQLTQLYVTAPRVRLATTVMLVVAALFLLAYSAWLLYRNLQPSDRRRFAGVINNKSPVLNLNAETPLTNDCDQLSGES